MCDLRAAGSADSRSINTMNISWWRSGLSLTRVDTAGRQKTKLVGDPADPAERGLCSERRLVVSDQTVRPTVQTQTDDT